MERKDLKNCFSNGTEYMNFLERQCYMCKNYVNWEEATDENKVCEIEDKISLAQFDILQFPDNELDTIYRDVKLNKKVIKIPVIICKHFIKREE